MSNINKVSVKICGKEYKLQTDETPEYIMGLAAEVDKQINDLAKEKPNFGIQNAAVIAALTSLDEAKKASESIDNIRSQIKFYVDDAAKARVSSTKAVVELREMKARVAELEKENKELKKKLEGFDCEQLVLENTIGDTVTIYAEPAAPKNEEVKEESKAEESKAKDTEPKAEENKTEAAEPKAQNASNGEEEKAVGEEKQPDGNESANGEAAADGGDALPNDDAQVKAVENQQRHGKGGSRGRKKKR